MAPGLGSRLRYLLQLIHADLDPEAQQYPDISEAVCELDKVVQEFLPAGPARRARGNQKWLVSQKVVRLKNQLKWARKGRRQAELELQRFTQGKQSSKQNRMTPEFLAKVALSSPVTCARSFSAAWRDLVGVGVVGCSRPTITSIRDAFTQVVKEHNELAIGIAVASAVKFVKSATSRPGSSSAVALESFSSATFWPGCSSAVAPEFSSSATSRPASSSAVAPESSSSATSRPGSGSAVASSATFFSAALLRIHDEASLRLRSSGDSAVGPPSRSRRSKVQQHSLQLRLPGQQPIRCFAELDALADKTAQVLATSLHKAFMIAAGTVATALGAAAMTQRPWFIHIVVGDGIPTNTAACKILLAWKRRDPLPHGVLYFLMCVKCASHQANLAVAAAVCKGPALAGAHTSADLGESPLAQRYLADRADSAAQSVCGAIVRFFKYLVSDYYSDFLANLQELVGRLRASDSSLLRQQEHQKSLNLQALYGDGVFPPGLLDALNGGVGVGDWVHCLAPESAADAPEDRLSAFAPVYLRFCGGVSLWRWTFPGACGLLVVVALLGCARDLVKLRGSVRERTVKRVSKVLAFLAKGDTPQYLRRTSLALQLPAHALNISGQLRDEEEPLLVRLAKGVVGAAVCKDLHRLLHRLHLDPDLDQGAAVAVLLAEAMDLCLRFRQYSAWPFAAWSLCSKYNPSGYMPACMDFLEIPEESFDVGFALQLRHVADQAGATHAKRLQYLLSPQVQQALASAFQASSASSLPVERAFAETKRSEAPRLCHVATAGRNQILRQYLRQREELLVRAEAASIAMRRSLKTNLASLAWEVRPDLADRALDGTASADMRQFMSQNEESLKAEVARRRQAGRSAVEQASCGPFPVTKASWTDWFRTNEDSFFVTMQRATKERREMNRRLRALPDLPKAVPRLGPRIGSKVKHADRPQWQKLCWNRTGWYGLLMPSTGVRTLFLYTFDKFTYCMDFSPFRNGRGFLLCQTIELNIDKLLIPLEDFKVGEVAGVVELFVSAVSAPDGLRLLPSQAQVVITPLKGPARGRKRQRASSEGSDSSEASSARSEDSAEAPFDKMYEDMQGSSTDSSHLSVDTEADSAAEEVLASKKINQILCRLCQRTLPRHDRRAMSLSMRWILAVRAKRKMAVSRCGCPDMLRAPGRSGRTSGSI